MSVIATLAVPMSPYNIPSSIDRPAVEPTFRFPGDTGDVVLSVTLPPLEWVMLKIIRRVARGRWPKVRLIYMSPLSAFWVAFEEWRADPEYILLSDQSGHRCMVHPKERLDSAPQWGHSREGEMHRTVDPESDSPIGRYAWLQVVSHSAGVSNLVVTVETA